MDIAGFVGFAAAGPLHVPVALEDPSQFEEVFGGDATLAWDRGRGEPATAHLGPAVRSFFRNGGQRCHVVRVAGAEAEADRYELPGLACADAAGHIRHALLSARSAGSWADELRVGTALTATPLAARVLRLAPPQLTLAAPTGVAPGDVLRVRFPRTRWALVMAVASAGPDGVTAGERVWMGPVERSGTPQAGEASWIDRHGVRRWAPTEVEPVQDGPLRLSVATPPERAPAPGAALRLRLARQSAWLQVADVVPGSSRQDARADRIAVGGHAVVLSRGAPDSAPALREHAVVERLELELTVAAGSGPPVRLGGLGLAAGHARFLGALPTDEHLYETLAGRPPARELEALVAGAERLAAFWRAAGAPRFPLAAAGEAPRLFVPLGAGIVHATLPARVPDRPAQSRDGLATMDPGLFSDPALAGLRTDVLLRTADAVRYLGDAPSTLAGMHALLDVDEVSLVGIPDAVQPGWSRPTVETPAAATPLTETKPAAPKGFTGCAPRRLAAPRGVSAAGPLAGAVTVRWDAVEGAAEYELQEAVDPDFRTAVTAYRGAATTTQLFGRPRDGTRYYQVRALAPGVQGEWGRARAWSPAAPDQELDESSDRSRATLLTIHRDLLRMCAARGDVLALLALPEDDREDAAIAHVRALAQGSAGVDQAALGFGAVHHPWLVEPVERPSGAFVRVPPDGAAAGVLASRALRRGAWVAPANEPLRDVVALTPAIAERARLPLYEAQLNLVRHEPEGFLWLSADTLAADPIVRPINVRRLLQLLRRTAVRNGAIYAFEPNGAALRRAIERGFDALLTQMFLGGAFAGATPGESYRVTAGDPPNTPGSVDAGRLIVELRVAPSRPLTFLTVRLVRSGDGALRLEGD